MNTDCTQNKIAFCFFVSGNHSLPKEYLWREWLNSLSVPHNVYIHYTSFESIQSPWIRAHCLPIEVVKPASYFHMVPAYFAVMRFAIVHDTQNQWFVFLTDSCCPIVSPRKFTELLLRGQSIFAWKPAWWNPHFCRRSNLRLLPPALHLGNDPWFILSKCHVETVLNVSVLNMKNNLVQTVCRGGIANESIFAILLRLGGKLPEDKKNGDTSSIVCASSHLCDWSHMSSSTSPRVFFRGDASEINWIKTNRERYSCFLRKVNHSFPDSVIRRFWEMMDD